MAELRTGTVTFLFTGIKGSTALWERGCAAMVSCRCVQNLLLDTFVGRLQFVRWFPLRSGSSLLRSRVETRGPSGPERPEVAHVEHGPG
jgi:hypothetical protein